MANAKRPKRTGRRRAEFVIMQATDSNVAEKEVPSEDAAPESEDKTTIIVDGSEPAEKEEIFDATKLKKEEYKVMEERDKKDIDQ